MKKVAILGNYNTNILPSSDKMNAYIELEKVFKDEWIELMRVSMDSFNPNKGSFTHFIQINSEGFFETQNKEYVPQLIWNRIKNGIFYFSSITRAAPFSVFPNDDLVRICSDKFEMYLFLREYFPTTFLLDEFLSSVTAQEILTDELVLKPIRSNVWKGIIFTTKSKLLDSASIYQWLWKLYIVQNRIRLSWKWLFWVPHDVRLVFIWGEFSHSTIRISHKNEESINTNMVESFLPRKEIPDEVMSMAYWIMKKLWNMTKSLIAIDFMLDSLKNNWYLMEINSSPWVDFYGNETDRNYFYNAYYRDLAKFINTLI